MKNKDKCNQNGKDWRERSELVSVPEDESELVPHALPRLSIVPPCSTSSSVDALTTKSVKPSLSHGDESMTVLLSAFYAKLLIVLGIALPVTSTIQNELYTNLSSDVSILEQVKRTRYGSFYLHMGVAGFSVGSIIYSCLQVGGYFDLRGDCRLLVVALKPALRILFTVAQTVFIFSYTDILDPMRGIVLHRFGLMHLIATNVCEWLNVVVQETRDDIITVAYDRPAMQRYANITGPPKITYETNHTYQDELSQNATQNITDLYNLSASETWTCNKSYKAQLAANATLDSQNKGYSKFKANNHYSVDCGSAHKGLFMGVAVLAGTIVSLMLFNGLFHNKKHVELALLQINIWETILFVLMAAGSAACIRRMRTLRLRRAVPALPLEHALLLVTQCGVYLYYLFQIIGAGFLIHRYPEARRATRIISPLCAVVQSSFQTLLVLDAWSRRCGGASRPGRQLVTFLLVGNFALWLLNRVKNSRAEFHPLQMEFYGVWAWTLITHVSVPLLVCYRFQATVCFYEIWKNSYKQNKDTRNEDFDDIELKNHVA
ncbi:unnamed protein product [Plutella xylostella]|uniref:(diamondback moth) hypothetical protein n=1 Tax=Plutella xylostella TaxID=51655 RepID=A0A8S4D5S8_PLUXY|nr:unnamed protein product [Plutella xylostella]